MNLTLTALEEKILQACRITDYGDAAIEPVWVFSVIDSAGIDGKVARGVIASLVKKGLVMIEDYEGKGNSDDQVFVLTDAGIKIISPPQYSSI